MKKLYIQPAMIAVVLQHTNQVLTSSPYSNGGNWGGNDGGEDPGQDPGGRAKGSVNVWDEEW